jgi:hypothetical protein
LILAGTKLSANLQSQNVREQTPSALGFREFPPSGGVKKLTQTRYQSTPAANFLRKFCEPRKALVLNGPQFVDINESRRGIKTIAYPRQTRRASRFPIAPSQIISKTGREKNPASVATTTA